MNPNGTMNCPGGRSSTVSIVSRRAKWPRKCCAELGLLAKEEPYENNVGFSERADVPIEPRLSEQWFLKYPRWEARAAVGAERRDEVSSRSAGRRFTITGWRTFRIGASAASFGGGIASRSGIAATGSATAEHRSRRSGDGLDAGPRRARHLVLLAGSGRLRRWAGRRRAQKFYPTTDLVTGAGHYLLLGRAHDHGGLRIHRRDAVPEMSISPASSATSRDGRCRKSLGNSPDPLDLIAKYGADGAPLRPHAHRAASGRTFASTKSTSS